MGGEEKERRRLLSPPTRMLMDVVFVGKEVGLGRLFDVVEGRGEEVGWRDGCEEEVGAGGRWFVGRSFVGVEEAEKLRDPSSSSC